MKKYLVLITLFISILSYSQDYLDIIGKETCECINAKKTDLSAANTLELQTNVGSCMMNSYSIYKDKMDPKDKAEYGDIPRMRKLGENVALKMLTHCPDVIMALGNSVKENKTASENGILILEGEFLRTKISDFLTIEVKETNGRIHNLLLLNYFVNAEFFTNEILKKNDKISIGYKEQEFYDPKSKEYKYFKVIYNLNKI